MQSRKIFIRDKKFYVPPGVSRGRQRIPVAPSKTSKNPEGNVSTSGNLPPERSKLRAGLEENSGAHRAAAALSVGPEKKEGKRSPPLLGDPRVPLANLPELSRLAIQSGTPLLVYQRDGLPGKAPGELEQEDEGLPGLSGIYRQYEILTALFPFANCEGTEVRTKLEDLEK